MEAFPEGLDHCTGFQWDAGNTEKNWSTHQVTQADCEQSFFNRPVLVAPDFKHSEIETRFALLGQTNAGCKISVVFTIRNNLVRVMAAWDMSRRDRRTYGHAQTDN